MLTKKKIKISLNNIIVKSRIFFLYCSCGNTVELGLLGHSNSKASMRQIKEPPN
jgi:hypothetical protein